MNKLFMYFLLVLLLVPTAFAAQPITIEERFQVFVDGFEGIDQIFTRNGRFDSGPLVRGTVAILPVTGLVAIVFGLMFFVTKISIFKSPDHDRYARMIAFGIALIGLAMPAVYNIVLGLSTTFLVLLFVVAVIFIFIMFVNYNRKEHFKSYGELQKVSGDMLSAKRDLEKIKHDLNMETKLREKTDRDLEMVESDLNNIDHLVGNELEQVDKIANLLRKAVASYNSGDSQAVNQFVKALTKDIGGLITTMQHEQKHSYHLSTMISQIETELAKWGHSNDKEKSDEEHLKKLFHKFSGSWGHKIKDDEITDLYREEKHLVSKLHSMRNHLHRLQALYDKMMGDTENLDKASYQRKHLEANAVRDNIMNQQFAEAHKHLDNLRAIIEYEPHVIKQFREHESELRSLLSKIDSEEKQLNQMIQGRMLKTLKSLRKKAEKKKEKEKKKDKDKEKEEKDKAALYRRQKHMFASWIDDVLANISQLVHIAHPYLTEERVEKVKTRRGKQNNYTEHKRRQVEEIYQALNAEYASFIEFKRKLDADKLDLIDFAQALIDRIRSIQARLKILERAVPGDIDHLRSHMIASSRRLSKIVEHLAEYIEEKKKKDKKDKDKDAWDKAQDAEYTVLE